MSQLHQSVIGVTVGDPEITLKILITEKYLSKHPPIVFADRAILEQAMEYTDIKVPLTEVDAPGTCNFESHSIHFVPVNVHKTPGTTGEISADCGAMGHGGMD